MSSPEQSETSLRRDMRLSVRDGVGWAVMVGTGEQYIPAFVLALGLGEVSSGLVATLPMFCGALLQLFSTRGVRWLGSHRAWVSLCAASQALSFVPLVTCALLGIGSTWLIFALATLYWATGLATGAAWTTWISTLIPVDRRTRFFALRARFLHAGTLVGMLASGLALHQAKGGANELVVFAVLFALAGLSRGASAVLLSRHSEPVPMPAGLRDVHVADFLARLRSGVDGRLILFMLAMQASIQIAQPFMTPYMLKALRFEYVHYTLILAAPFVARVIALYVVARLAARLQTLRLLWIGGISLCPMAALWLTTTDWRLLLGANLLLGMALACYELATLLLFFEHIPVHERTSIVTYYNAFLSAAILGGSLMGGALLAALGETPGAYQAVFVASTCARLAALALLLRFASAARRAAPAAACDPRAAL